MKTRKPESHAWPLLWLWLAVLSSGAPAYPAELSVASSGRHLTVGGKPFFWLGDTAWLLAQVPSREEPELYLQTRAEQGFTVIQLTAVMGEERVWGTARPTSRGDIPFVAGDVLRPAITWITSLRASMPTASGRPW